MRIGFDITPLSAPLSGIGTYTTNLLDQLSHDPSNDVLLLSHRRMGWPVGSPPNKTLWMQTLLPWELARRQPDVCHFTNSVAPLWAPCPTVITIHDMTLWLFPECHPRRRLLAMKPIIPLAARRAARIIAVSESTKRDIVRILGVPAEKVDVIYEAAAPSYRVVSQGPELDSIRLTHRLPDRFILHVGTVEPRKNLIRLIEAFGRLWKAGMRSHQLVLVGQMGWKNEDLLSALEQLEIRDAVRFLDYVPTESLIGIYNLADVLVLPSLYEGFGLAMLEAMACGTPVLTSNRGSLSEIAGDAAEFIEPTEIDSIADGLKQLLAKGDRREELRKRGLLRAAHFNWETTADQTLRVYAAAAKQLPVPSPG